jgi:Transposase DDE domain
MSKPTPPSYRTTNWRTCNAALKQRGSLHIWFDPETVWLAEASGKRGRPATFTDAAIQACLTLKALFGLPLRQTTGLVASLLRLAGLEWAVPDFGTLSRRQKGLNVAIPYRPSTGALHLLIDSTGIKAEGEGEGEWFAKKHGPSKPRQWRKVHLGIDADTLEIRAIEVTGSRVGDAPMLPELLNQIPADQPIDKVSADGAYDTRSCHAAIHCPAVVCLQTTRGAARSACAVIPSRKNARPWLETTPGAQARNEILHATHRLGRTIWRRWSGYHRRSLVETKMRCFKLLGERVMARDFDRQVAELQIRAAILNRFTALGTPQTQRFG